MLLLQLHCESLRYVGGGGGEGGWPVNGLSTLVALLEKLVEW